MLKTGHNGSEIEVDGLPLDLCTSKWGFIFGMLPDVIIQRYEGYFKDQKLAEHISKTLNDLGIDCSVKRKKTDIE